MDLANHDTMAATETLAKVLTGQVPVAALDALPAAEWLCMAHQDGVSALLSARVAAEPLVSPGLCEALAARARGLAASELGQRAALVRVLETLREAGIPTLVLKGGALRMWLYPAPFLRETSDIDLLFADRAQARAAAAALAPAGYAVPYLPGPFAHELLCRRTGGGVDLDLHWGLTAEPALSVLPAFEDLFADGMPLPALGGGARGLGKRHSLLHACVHRASNLGAGLGDRLKWLYDIHLLAAALDARDWDEFVHGCRAARVSGIARSGLEASASLFGTPLPGQPLQQLQADAPQDALDAARLGDWRYLQRRNLAALPGWTARARWLWSRAFPPSGYLRELYGPDVSRAQLLGTRLRRLLGRMKPAHAAA